MKIDQLEKTLEVIIANIDEDLFFVRRNDTKGGVTRSSCKRLATYSISNTYMNIDKIQKFIEDDNYVLIKVS